LLSNLISPIIPESVELVGADPVLFIDRYVNDPVLITEDVAIKLLAVKYVKLPFVAVTLLPLKLPVIPA